MNLKALKTFKTLKIYMEVQINFKGFKDFKGGPPSLKFN